MSLHMGEIMLSFEIDPDETATPTSLDEATDAPEELEVTDEVTDEVTEPTVLTVVEESPTSSAARILEAMAGAELRAPAAEVAGYQTQDPRRGGT